MLISLFLALLLLLRLGLTISSTLHRLMMLSHHLLLMVLGVHWLLMMHHLLIHPMLSVTSIYVFVSFVHFGLVTLSGVIVAMNVFSLVFVPVSIFSRVLVAVFFTGHSCSLAAMFSHVPTTVFGLSGSSFAPSANASSAFALPVSLIK